jgi:Zn finger protein HypA/HybF involved in hydrogenase expression
MILACLNCDAEIEVEEFGMELVICPTCGTKFSVEFDDGYIEGEGENWETWLEEIDNE